MRQQHPLEVDRDWSCGSCGFLATVVQPASIRGRCVLDTHPEGQPETVLAAAVREGRPVCPSCGTPMVPVGLPGNDS